jgi:hypothetical protein
VPGAGAVGGISYPPINSLIVPIVRVRRTDGELPDRSNDVPSAYFLITPGLFAALRTPIVHGREFDASDAADAPWRIVVNQTMADLCWPGENPIGQQLRLDAGVDEKPRLVIGVVGDIPTRLDRIEPQPIVYASYLQQPAHYSGPAVGMFGSLTVVMRPTAAIGDVLDASRRALAELAPNRPIASVGVVTNRLWGRTAERRNYVAAIAVGAAAAALLAIVAIYGMMAYAFAARAGEIAVRKALGARRRDLVAAMTRPALFAVAAGLTAGLLGAAGLARLIAEQLWGVAPGDVPVFTVVSAAWLVAALTGCIGPLRRALALNPAARLRSE